MKQFVVDEDALDSTHGHYIAPSGCSIGCHHRSTCMQPYVHVSIMGEKRRGVFPSAVEGAIHQVS